MPIRIASVPSGHPYVRNLGTAGGAVERLPDEPVPGVAPTAARWWPPPMLDPGWVEANRDRFDVFHVHFGFDAAGPEDLRELGRALRRVGKPLVFTVHDLENPHHGDQGRHRSQVGALLEGATEVVTLTPGAAARISSEYGRTATVIAHPHIVPFERMRDRRGRVRNLIRREASRSGGPVTAGLHLKSLRRNMNPLPVLEAAVEEVRESPDQLALRVDIHRDAWQGTAQHSDPALISRLETLSESGVIDLRVHDFFSDDEFFEYLESIEVSVLPYGFGTHSGWLEACRDLGTSVVAPDCGFYSQQGAVCSFHVIDGDPVRASVRYALRSAAQTVHRIGRSPVGTAFRRRQRRAIAEAHLAVYERATRKSADAAADPGHDLAPPQRPAGGRVERRSLAPVSLAKARQQLGQH